MSQSPSTVAPDVLVAVGLDPDAALSGTAAPLTEEQRRRSSAWPARILRPWDYRCLFCGYDGRLGSGVVGLEAAHVRWFNLGGPEDPDNGLALCSLHHKLFDRGALGLSPDHCVIVSSEFSARTDAARLVYDLHGCSLKPRRGTAAVPHTRGLASARGFPRFRPGCLTCRLPSGHSVRAQVVEELNGPRRLGPARGFLTWVAFDLETEVPPARRAGGVLITFRTIFQLSLRQTPHHRTHAFDRMPWNQHQGGA